MARTVAIIQARMGSTRLPGKVLLPLAGKPSLWHIVNRLRAVDAIDEVVVATSTASGDDAIREFCADADIKSFSGSENDVLDRYYRAAEESQATTVLRVTADCPLLDSDVTNDLMAIYAHRGFDYLGIASGGGVASLGLNGFPDGLGVSVMPVEAIAEAFVEAVSPDDREHVTPYIWRNRERFRHGYLVPTHDYSEMRWTIDHPEDYELVSRVYEALSAEEGEIFGFADVLAYLASHPDVANLNAMHVGHEKYRHLWSDLAVEPKDVRVWFGPGDVRALQHWTG